MQTRFLSRPFIIKVPFFSEYSVLIRGPENKNGKRVLPRNLARIRIGFWEILFILQF